MAAARNVAFRPPKGFGTTAVHDGAYMILMSCGVSGRSFGEDITIRVFADPRGGSVLTIVSKPIIPTTLVDWGKGKKNVATLRDAILWFLNSYR